MSKGLGESFMTKSARSVASQSTAVPTSIAVFPTRLGWMALVGCAGAVRQLRFGFPSAKTALAAVEPQLRLHGRIANWNRALIARLKRYAAGSPDDFTDVVVDFGLQTPFQRRVMAACRAIPYGKARTYGQLAAAAGSPVPRHRPAPSRGRPGRGSGRPSRAPARWGSRPVRWPVRMAS